MSTTIKQFTYQEFLKSFQMRQENAAAFIRLSVPRSQVQAYTMYLPNMLYVDGSPNIHSYVVYIEDWYVDDDCSLTAEVIFPHFDEEAFRFFETHIEPIVSDEMDWDDWFHPDPKMVQLEALLLERKLQQQRQKKWLFEIKEHPIEMVHQYAAVKAMCHDVVKHDANIEDLTARIRDLETALKLDLNLETIVSVSMR